MASGEARIREFLWNVDSRLIEFCQFKFILTRNSTFYFLGKIRRVYRVLERFKFNRVYRYEWSEI